MSQNLPPSGEGKTQLDESRSFHLSCDGNKMRTPQTNEEGEDISTFADLKIDSGGNNYYLLQWIFKIFNNYINEIIIYVYAKMISNC